MDNETNRRWVMRFDDPKQLTEIDAVSVTVEPKGGSHKPTNKPFLYAPGFESSQSSVGLAGRNPCISSIQLPAAALVCPRWDQYLAKFHIADRIDWYTHPLVFSY